MFKRIKMRMQDIKTISNLIPGANKHAHGMGEKESGEEHFLLSALELPDGTAQRVFDRIGVSPEQFQVALEKQYSEALSSVDADENVLEDKSKSTASNRDFLNSNASGKAVMKALRALKIHDKDRPLLSAHVVEVIAKMEHGVSARAFQTMGIDKNAILLAVEEELDSFSL